MNLIEQLGGYEKAKVILQAVGHEHDAMLREYRRQHNIFEVGDKVFRIDEDGPILTVDRILVCEDDYRRTIIDIDWKGGFGWVRAFKLKHATDAEIEAAERSKTIDSDIDKQVNLMDQFIADGGFDKAFVDVFGLPESVKKSLGEVS